MRERFRFGDYLILSGRVRTRRRGDPVYRDHEARVMFHSYISDNLIDADRVWSGFHRGIQNKDEPDCYVLERIRDATVESIDREIPIRLACSSQLSFDLRRRVLQERLTVWQMILRGHYDYTP